MICSQIFDLHFKISLVLLSSIFFETFNKFTIIFVKNPDSKYWIENRDSLLLVSTVFTILSGQGEALNIDPASFYIHLYNNMFLLDSIRYQNL